jgi:glycosyltransferase involved in cell wall biosynthesis
LAINFSLIICTYNPDPNIFNRLIRSVKQFGNNYPFQFEVIIVDNNSSTPVAETREIETLTAAVPCLKVIRETKPGLTAARMAGITNAEYEWLVFLDDDNEPAADYLQQASQLIESYTDVACWGPGEVNVEYVDAVETSWLQSVKPCFQQKKMEGVIMSADKDWKEHYPAGTGLIIRKDVCVKYTGKVKSGEYTLSDRNGKSLSSGGDVQMVFTAVAMGYKAGISGTIKMNHLIKAEKTSMKYLVKLFYGTASSYLLAFNQVFSEKPIPVVSPNNKIIIKTIYSTFRISLFKKGIKQCLLDLGNRMGEINARFVCMPSQKKPLLLSLYEKIISY